MKELNLYTKLQQQIRTLQQKLRRTKKMMNTMHEVIRFLPEKLVLNPKESEALQSTLNIKFLYNFQDNIKSAPSARRYSDEIKEFALTLYFYSPRTYKYIRSLVWLFTYGKKYTKEIASENNQSIRHKF
jgi:heme oxygenase